MSISPALQAIYQYTDKASMFWNALVLSHSTWGDLYLTSYHESIQATFNGAMRLFEPYPFDIVLPSRDGEGQQDMSLAIANVGNVIYTTLNRAIAIPSEPIRARFTVYIHGNANPQIDPPYELTLTNITAKELTVAGTATRFNVFSLPFPSIPYRPDSFPGLNRR